jgi:hypothetical protein
MGTSLLRKVGFFVVPLFSLACGDVNLVKKATEAVNTKSQGNFCISPPEDLNRFTKFMFVVDKSGSNTSTDPGADKRYTNIMRFYDENMTEPYFKWGLIAYVNTEPITYIENPYFSQDDAQIRQGIERLREGDSGGTPYGSALARTKDVIRQDIQDNRDEESIYMIFFISDGDPTDISDVNALRGLVDDIQQLSPGKIFMSTAYYGPNSAGAIHRLEQMADAGDGKFVNFNNTDELDFNELIVRPTKEPWQIKNTNLMVYNVNAATCLNGKVSVDSDADGMCDEDELRYGLNPAKRNSFPSVTDSRGNATDLRGYGDYFHWRRIVFGETLPPCSDSTDEDHDLLTKCEEAYIINQRPSTVFPDGTPRYNGDPKNPDTDLDGYLDGIEILMFKDKGSANDYLNVLRSYDGEADSSGTQIRQHRNPTVFDPNVFKYDIVINPIGYEEGRACYAYAQSRLELFTTIEVKAGDTLPGLEHVAGDNSVFVHYVQTPQSDKDGPGVLKYSIQKLRADQRVNDSRGTAAGVNVEVPFDTYVVPNN